MGYRNRSRKLAGRYIKKDKQIIDIKIMGTTVPDQYTPKSIIFFVLLMLEAFFSQRMALD